MRRRQRIKRRVDRRARLDGEPRQEPPVLTARREDEAAAMLVKNMGAVRATRCKRDDFLGLWAAAGYDDAPSDAAKVPFGGRRFGGVGAEPLRLAERRLEIEGAKRARDQPRLQTRQFRPRSSPSRFQPAAGFDQTFCARHQSATLRPAEIGCL